MNNLDKIFLEKGELIKFKGLPFILEDNITVLGKTQNKKLADGYKSFGVPSVLTDAQSDTSETINPSSESIKPLK